MEEGFATVSSLSAAERQAAIRSQLAQVDLSAKDKDTAFIIELVLGIFGLLGIGYMYAGLTNAGIIRLVGYWIFLTVLWPLFGVFVTLTSGFGLCLFFVPLILQLAIVYFSADDLKKSMAAVKGTVDGSVASGDVGGYIADRPSTIRHDPMQDLERDLHPGIERELEQDRLDQARRAAEPPPSAERTPPVSGARSYPETPVEEEDKDEDEL